MSQKRKRWQYSLLSRDPEVNERALNKLEGEYARLRQLRQDKKELPRALPPVHIATLLGCSPGTVKRWLMYHDAYKDADDISERFCEIYHLIASLLAESLSSKMFDIAYSADNPKQFNALMYLLPKADPVIYGDEQVSLGNGGSGDLDIPQEAYDALTEEEREELRRLEDEVDAKNSLADQIIARGVKRARDSETDAALLDDEDEENDTDPEGRHCI